MESYDKNPRNTVKRAPKRANYDKKAVYEILDAGWVCQIAFVVDGQPFIIPVIYGRKDDVIYVHGSVKSRLMKSMGEGIPVCLNVTFTDGMVLARSAFHHSANYRSVSVFGKATIVPVEEKNEAFKIMMDQMLKGRWEESRQPNQKELDITEVLAVKIEDAVAKVRTGPPVDDKKDLDLPIWAGVLPLKTVENEAIADEFTPVDMDLPDSVKRTTSKI